MSKGARPLCAVRSGLVLQRFATQALLGLLVGEEEALLVRDLARLLAMPADTQRDLGEVEEAELRAPAIGLLGEFLDALVALVGVEPEVIVDLLELRLASTCVDATLRLARQHHGRQAHRGTLISQHPERVHLCQRS